MYMAGFPGHAAPRAVFLCFRMAHDASHHGRYAPRSGWLYWLRCSSRCAPVLSSGPRSSASWPGPELQKTADSTQLQFIAGHRHYLFRRGSSSWSRLFSRPQRFPSCCSMVDVPVMWGADSQVLPWRRPCRSHSCSSDSFYDLVSGSHLFGVRL